MLFVSLRLGDNQDLIISSNDYLGIVKNGLIEELLPGEAICTWIHRFPLAYG